MNIVKFTPTNAVILERLIGQLSPIGESNTDESRLQNLKDACELMDELMVRIFKISYEYKDSHEHSCREIGQYADKYLKNTLEYLKEATS